MKILILGLLFTFSNTLYAQDETNPYQDCVKGTLEASKILYLMSNYSLNQNDFDALSNMSEQEFQVLLKVEGYDEAQGANLAIQTCSKYFGIQHDFSNSSDSIIEYPSDSR